MLPSITPVLHDHTPTPAPQWAIATATDPMTTAVRQHNAGFLTLAIAATPDPDTDVEKHLSALCARLAVTRRRATILTDIGLFLSRFPALIQFLTTGILSPDHLSMLARVVDGARDEDVFPLSGDIIRTLIPRHDNQTLPGVGALRNQIRAAIVARDALARPLDPGEHLDTRTAEQKAAAADSITRTVSATRADPDSVLAGTTTITATLPDHEAEEFTTVLDALCRTLDCSRADALLHMARGTAEVSVTLNLYRDPGSPVATTAGGTWLTRIATDQFMDRVSHLRILSADATETYTPPDRLVRFVKGRDGTCRYPGCDIPAEDCEVDHIQRFNHDDPASGGPTTTQNLHCLCTRHHQMKTMGWSEVTTGPDGTEVWTSIDDGHEYITVPTGPLARYARSTFTTRATRRFTTLRDHNRRRLAEQQLLRDILAEARTALDADTTEEVPF